MSGFFREGGCSSGRPCSSASRLTGLPSAFMPRPAGRSGCVSTSATSCPAEASAATARAANSGVPAKIRRIGLPLHGFAHQLLQLVADAGLLEPRQVFDKHLALEVVPFVLD